MPGVFDSDDAAYAKYCDEQTGEQCPHGCGQPEAQCECPRCEQCCARLDRSEGSLCDSCIEWLRNEHLKHAVVRP
jgi:hypothetical protein